jgi:hypothetical protein
MFHRYTWKLIKWACNFQTQTWFIHNKPIT